MEYWTLAVQIMSICECIDKMVDSSEINVVCYSYLLYYHCFVLFCFIFPEH